MIQTTNGIFNKTLYDLSTPKALLAWHRVRLANWLASSGEEWANYVSQYNSGICIHAQKIIIMVNMHGTIHVHVLSVTVNTSVLAHIYSGTYNNQYMVLDMKKVELKKAIQDGALWVVEQIPGYYTQCILVM